MANVDKHNASVGAWPNETKVIRVLWDFAEDGGATGDYALATLSQDMVVLDYYTDVKTTCTSGGSATMNVGVDGGDEDAFLDITSGAVASLTADTIIDSETAGARLRVASAGVLQMQIATAAMTAGKVEFVWVLSAR